ncbi:hypothetical protein ElyMa_005612700 [Elysia marginata]|uniref:PiggyBac transposable element-derived protein domain-containing protein n=1 Tax=Elysia marginata TaxID=1093978 RepID=A0AAV4F6G4_9GAST|nr:hypothetical protein ElyMa_005612700 [Elysia marginata]
MESQSDSESEDNDDEWVHHVRHYPRIPTFTGNSGIKADLPEDPSHLDVYQLFITDELIASWKRDTNRYARTVIGSKDLQLLSKRSRFNTRKPVTLEEISLHLSL